MYGPRYGNVVDWEPGAAHRKDILGFPRARLVVEAQAYLMETLYKIVHKILDGFDVTQPARTEKWRELVATEGFKRIGEIERWSPYTNQAFSAPLLLNVGYLSTLAKTRLNAMGDHLWDLQCDGPYMRRHIKILMDVKVYQKVPNTDAGAFLASIIYREVFNYYWWRWIEIECIHVNDLHKQFGDSACQGHPLPVQYDRALCALELILIEQFIHRATALVEGLSVTAGFTNYWSVQRGANISSGRSYLSRNVYNNAEESLTDDPLDWYLMHLLCEPDNKGNFDHAMLFAFLHDHLAAATFKERARLGQAIYQILSDISTCHKTLLSIRLHRPQNSWRTFEKIAESENRKKWKWLKSEVDAGSRNPLISRQDLINMESALLEDFYQQKVSNGPKEG